MFDTFFCIFLHVFPNGTKFHNVFCWTSWLPEFFTPLKMTSSSTNDCWALKRDIIPCHNHNQQSIFLQNFGGIFFSQKLPPNRSRIVHHGITRRYMQLHFYFLKKKRWFFGRLFSFLRPAFGHGRLCHPQSLEYLE